MSDFLFQSQPSSSTSASSYSASNEIHNLGLTATVAANALTIALKTSGGSNPTSGDPTIIGFRNSTLATGQFAQSTVSAAVSLVISSGSTLGQVSATLEPIYVFAIESGSGVVLAAGTQPQSSDGELLTTTAEGGAGAADTRTTLYSTAAQTAKPGRLIGVIYSSQTTAGTWAAAVTSIQLQPVPIPLKYILSASCGDSSTSSSTYSDVTNLSVSFRTTGRPVGLRLIPDNSDSYIGVTATNVSTPIGFATFLRDAVTIAESRYEARAASSATDDPVVIVGVGAQSTVDFPPPGTYTYKVQFKATAGTMNISNAKLLAFELGCG